MKAHATIAFFVVAIFSAGAVLAVLWFAPALVHQWRSGDVDIQEENVSEE